jgi:DNA repair protein RadC
MRLKEFEIWLDEKNRPYLHEKETAVFDNGEDFRHPRQIYELAEKLGPTKHAYESSYVLYIALNMKVLGISEVGRGGIASSVVPIREVLQIALLCGATSLILFHNHPCDSFKPSQKDCVTTQKLEDAAALMELVLLDHVIVSNEGFYSFREQSTILRKGA